MRGAGGRGGVPWFGESSRENYLREESELGSQQSAESSLSRTQIQVVGIVRGVRARRGILQPFCRIPWLLSQDRKPCPREP
jgi:hypothetical protein